MNTDRFTSDGKLWISVSDIVQFYYCPRKFYLMKIGLPRKIMMKMDFGKKEYEREIKRIRRREEIFGFRREEVEELIEGWSEVDEELGLSGKLDFLLKVKGELIPVEVKYSEFRRPKLEWKKQIYAYALLIERKTGEVVKRGLIYVLPWKDVLEVKIDGEDKLKIIKDLDRIRRTLERGELPKKVNSAKCKYCEMREFCG